MGDISIEDTIKYNGKTYGITTDKLSQLHIWVYAPGNTGSHRAWQRVHTLEPDQQEDNVKAARFWIKNHL